MLEFHKDNQAFEVEVDKTHLQAIKQVYGKPLHFDFLEVSLNHINEPYDTVEVKNAQGTPLVLVYWIPLSTEEEPYLAAVREVLGDYGVSADTLRFVH